jgi:flagellar hook assembly protein FlgD
LQAQDPLDPMDPTQMMGELVSLNSLQQLIGIKQDLDSITGAISGTGNNSGSS